MNIVRRIWNDVRRGENIELYISVVFAFAVCILNLLGIAPQPWIASITLACLGILLLSALRNEHHNTELSQKLSDRNDSFFLEEFPPSIRTDIQNAKELWIVGVSQTTQVRTYFSEIRNVVQSGGIVKVLLVDPSGIAAEMASVRVFGRANLERTRNEIQASLEDFCELRATASKRVEIRIINHPLGQGVIAINPSTASGVLYIGNYPFKTQGGSKPKFLLRTMDGRWYDFYKSELINMWDNGSPWKCSDQ